MALAPRRHVFPAESPGIAPGFRASGTILYHRAIFCNRFRPFMGLFKVFYTIFRKFPVGRGSFHEIPEADSPGGAVFTEDAASAGRRFL